MTGFNVTHYAHNDLSILPVDLYPALYYKVLRTSGQLSGMLGCCYNLNNKFDGGVGEKVAAVIK